MYNRTVRRTNVQHDSVEVSAPEDRSKAVIVLLVRALMAFFGVSLAAIGAPLVMFGVGIPLLMLGMSLFLVAVDDDW